MIPNWFLLSFWLTDFSTANFVLLFNIYVFYFLKVTLRYSVYDLFVKKDYSIWTMEFAMLYTTAFIQDFVDSVCFCSMK